MSVLFLQPHSIFTASSLTYCGLLWPVFLLTSSFTDCTDNISYSPSNLFKYVLGNNMIKIMQISEMRFGKIILLLVDMRWSILLSWTFLHSYTVKLEDVVLLYIKPGLRLTLKAWARFSDQGSEETEESKTMQIHTELFSVLSTKTVRRCLRGMWAAMMLTDLQIL